MQKLVLPLFSQKYTERKSIAGKLKYSIEDLLKYFLNSYLLLSKMGCVTR